MTIVENNSKLLRSSLYAFAGLGLPIILWRLCAGQLWEETMIAYTCLHTNSCATPSYVREQQDIMGTRLTRAAWFCLTMPRIDMDRLYALHVHGAAMGMVPS
jgi:hypothetical protein